MNLIPSNDAIIQVYNVHTLLASNQTKPLSYLLTPKIANQPFASCNGNTSARKQEKSQISWIKDNKGISKSFKSASVFRFGGIVLLPVQNIAKCCGSRNSVPKVRCIRNLRGRVSTVGLERKGGLALSLNQKCPSRMPHPGDIFHIFLCCLIFFCFSDIFHFQHLSTSWTGKIPRAVATPGPHGFESL